MMPGLPLGFAQPLVLLGLLSLPVLWWLLRLIPPQPAPHRLPADAPPVRHRAEGGDAARARPGGSRCLRLTLAALVIIAAAGPLWNPPLATSTAAPLALLIDDGWAAAATWDARCAPPTT